MERPTVNGRRSAVRTSKCTASSGDQRYDVEVQGGDGRGSEEWGGAGEAEEVEAAAALLNCCSCCSGDERRCCSVSSAHSTHQLTHPRLSQRPNGSAFTLQGAGQTDTARASAAHLLSPLHSPSAQDLWPGRCAMLQHAAGNIRLSVSLSGAAILPTALPLTSTRCLCKSRLLGGVERELVCCRICSCCARGSHRWMYGSGGVEGSVLARCRRVDRA